MYRSMYDGHFARTFANFKGGGGGGGGEGDVKFKEFPGFLEFQESVETLYLRAISLEKT